MGFRLVRSVKEKPCPVRLCKAEVFIVGAGVEGMLHTHLPSFCPAAVIQPCDPPEGRAKCNGAVVDSICSVCHMSLKVCARAYTHMHLSCYCHVSDMSTHAHCLSYSLACCRQPSDCPGSDRGWPCRHNQLSVLLWVQSISRWAPDPAVPLRQDSASGGLCSGCGAETGSEDTEGSGVWVWAWSGLLSTHKDLQRGAT